MLFASFFNPPQGQWKIMKSIISLKSIKSIELTTKKLLLSIFIDWPFQSISYRQLSNYWLVFRYLFLSASSGRVGTEQVIVGRGWLEIWQFFFLPFLHSSLVWNNLFQIKYMIDSKIVVGLEIPIGFEAKKAIFVRVRCRGETGIEGTSPPSRKCHGNGGLPRLCSVPTGILEFLLKNLTKSWRHMLYRETQYFGTSNALISDNK